MAGRDTGMSSMALARYMAGIDPDREDPDACAYPLDPDDLGRCLRLLERFPEWKERLPEMEALDPVWGALAEHWYELAALYHEEARFRMAPKCYKRMRELIDPLRYVRPTFIHPVSQEGER